MPNRGSFNRRTGKTTPRRKAKTHWAAKGSSKKARKAVAASPAKAK